MYILHTKGMNIRIVGCRKEPQITFSASGDLLAEGARFNDEIHRLPSGKQGFIPKGLYRFKSHEEANRFDLDCLAKFMARMSEGSNVAIHGRNGED